MEQETVNTNLGTQNVSSLREHILKAIEGYFKIVDGYGHQSSGPSNVVLEEIESAMYEGIMRFTRGNQSRAAKILGVSRGTLRTKLMQYFGTTHVGGIYRV